MAFENFTAFFAMGGHAAYIWSAYGIFILTLITLHFSAKNQHRKLNNQLNALKNHES